MVGMMTHVCVPATVHFAFERGFALQLLRDAAATRALDGAHAAGAQELKWAHRATLDECCPPDRRLPIVQGGLSAARGIDGELRGRC